MHDVPYGFCHCGCGKRTIVNTRTDRGKGWFTGEPRRYLQGHSNTPQRPQYEVRDCGYETACWVWLWCRKPGHNYGTLWDSEEKRARPAHRIYYERYVGPVPEGLELDHLCRNGSCVNPEHLEPVTHAENIRRGKSRYLKGTCRNGHPWIPENIYVTPGEGVEYCRPCLKIRQARQKRGAS